jgi:hypothetical protein
MTFAPGARLGRTILFVAALLLGAVGAACAHADHAPPADDAYLDALAGEWDMAGAVRGKAVHYRARGERVLQGGFLRVHMIEAASVPLDEADVFLGFDRGAGDSVAHWLDRFGAVGARADATGRRDGQRLVIVFP